MTTHPRRAVFALVAVTVTSCATSQEPRSVTIPAAGARPVSRIELIYDYRTAAATIAKIFERDLAFAPFPATFHFYRNSRAFEAVLLDAGYDAALASSTARTMTAVGGHRRVLLNEQALDRLDWPERIGLLAHELAHSLQYELGGGHRGASDQWLREGFAEWLSVGVLERLDGLSLAAFRRHRQIQLHAMGRAKTPRLSDLVTFPQWVEIGGRLGAGAYAYAFLAVEFLIERHGVPAVVGYFERFATSQDRVANFRHAFGEDIEAFESALTRRVWSR